ncbi:MAG: hypothetical protein Q7U91_15975 [Sideroxyarcus sp.]|nr:hypothetical protein [Sideroxyarcus sp.]
MTEEERWDHLKSLDDALLKGGVILSGWCTFIVQEADIAFAKGAHLASILTSVAGIETYLRSEYATTNRETLYSLIEIAPLEASLKNDLHELRIYRNNWVHVDEPWQDRELERSSEPLMSELEEMSMFAVQVLRRTIYENQWV